jgi:monofunctional biosynthetic peptidoglycan transglycosylase
LPRRRSPARFLIGRVAIAVLATLFVCSAYSWITLPDVRPLASRPPERTAFMDLRAAEARAAGTPVRERRHWLPYSRISLNLRRAVLLAEDAGFWDHDGVDYAELRASFETSVEQGTAMRGASTLTQQLAKNLYLSPSRNPWRKVVELMITRRLEAELSKTRIFELYLNSVEWGDGIWGADAAARAYFGRPASDLTPAQAALMAGALINARVYSPARPNARLLARQRIILGRMARGAAPAAAPPPAAPAQTGPLESATPVIDTPVLDPPVADSPVTLPPPPPVQAPVTVP